MVGRANPRLSRGLTVDRIAKSRPGPTTNKAKGISKGPPTKSYFNNRGSRGKAKAFLTRALAF